MKLLDTSYWYGIVMGCLNMLLLRYLFDAPMWAAGMCGLLTLTIIRHGRRP